MIHAQARLRALVEVTQTFAAATTDYLALLQTVAAQTGRFMNGYCNVSVISDDGRWLESVADFAENPAFAADLNALPALGRLPLDGDSVSATVVRTGISRFDAEMITPGWNATAPSVYGDLFERHGLRSVACVPMRFRGKVIGTLSAGRLGPTATPLNEADTDLLQVLADHAAQLIVSARLLQREQLGAARLRALVEITQTFTRVGDLRRLFRTIAEQAGRFLKGYSRLGVISDDGTTWLPLADFAEDTELAAAIAEVNAKETISLDGPTMLARVARTGESLLIPDVQVGDWKARFPPDFVRLAERHNLRGFACVAMRSEGKTLGTLGVGQAGGAARAFDAEDLALLQVLADHAAQAIVNGRLLEAVRRELEEHKQTRDMLDRSEEKLRQVAKMEAVGRLAGGVAHDFNNILSIILSYSEVAIEGLRMEDPMRRDLIEIQRAGERAGELTRQLLAFSRQQIMSPRILNLNSIVTGIEPMLRRLLGEDIALHFVPEPHLYVAKVDPGQVEQILMNLVVNARDAMPDGGSITIETANVMLDEGYVAAHPEASIGPHAALSVSDSGIGMTRDVLARIFEPFFTTKPTGTGTGLGLATVYGIVKQSGGCVWVYSEPDKGTTFKVYFPRAFGPEAQASSPAASSENLRGSETILVVEDEAQVRVLVRDILLRAGYHVIEASNGGEAFLVCEQYGATIQMLLTDIVMPRMNGRQLAERLRQIRPDIKVLFMSGYTENAIVHHGVLDSGLHFLQKPITPDRLLRKVREVLG
ncbi:MAG: GAF domain-containing protein [Polyangiaceae bacterium]|jgi:signal transduction histidine kinase